MVSVTDFIICLCRNVIHQLKGVHIVHCEICYDILVKGVIVMNSYVFNIALNKIV